MTRRDDPSDEEELDLAARESDADLLGSADARDDGDVRPTTTEELVDRLLALAAEHPAPRLAAVRGLRDLLRGSAEGDPVALAATLGERAGQRALREETATRARLLARLLGHMTAAAPGEAAAAAELAGLLEEFSSRWPACGAPWAWALLHAPRTPDALELARRAHRAADVDDADVRECLRRWRDGPGVRGDLERTLARLVAERWPSIRHLAEWADACRRDKAWEELGQVVERVRRIHGLRDPLRWSVTTVNDRLAAGLLCGNIAALAVMAPGLLPGERDLERWTRASEHFLERALEETTQPARRRVVLKRLSAQLRRRVVELSRAAAVDEALLDQKLARLEAVASELAYLGRADYNVSRDLAFAYGAATSCAMRRPGVLGHRVPKWLDLAHSHFMALRYHEDRDKDGITEAWIGLLLVANAFERAEAVVERFGGAALSRPMLHWQQGRHEEAVEAVLAFVARPGANIVGCAALLHRWTRAGDLRPALVAQVRQAARAWIGLLVTRVTRALEESDPEAAERYLEIAEWASGAVRPELLHLRARLLDQRLHIEGGDAHRAAERVRALYEASGLDWRTNPFLVGTYLGVLARADQGPDPAELWDLAYRRWPSPTAPDGAELDRRCLTKVLRHLVRRREWDGWAGRFLVVLRQFPDPEDVHLQRPLGWAWRTGERGRREVCRVLDFVSRLEELDAWLLALLPELPDELFLSAEARHALRFAVQRAGERASGDLPRLVTVIVAGCVRAGVRRRGQLLRGEALEAAALDPESLVEEVADVFAWLDGLLPPGLRPAWCAHWLGSERGALERTVALALLEHVEHAAADFRAAAPAGEGAPDADLDDAAAPPARWGDRGNEAEEAEDVTLLARRHDATDAGSSAESAEVRRTVEALTSLFERVRRSGRGTGVAPRDEAGWAPLRAHCVAAQAAFTPDALDHRYWPRLRELVTGWMERRPDAHELARAWLQLVDALDAVVVRRVAGLSLGPLHALKADLLRGKVGPGWRQRLEDALRQTRRLLSFQRWPRHAPVDLDALVADVCLVPPFVPDAAEARGQAPRLHLLRPRAPLVVSCDGAMVREVVRSLLQNALRATDATGWLVVRTWAEGARAFVEVEDGGSGVDEERLRDLNELREPMLGTLGSGLGTMIAHWIAHAHRGRLTFHHGADAARSGLRARLELPVEAEADR